MINKIYYFLIYLLVFGSCIANKSAYIDFEHRLKNENPDGREFIEGQILNAVNQGLINENPLVVIDAIVLGNTEIVNQQYKILFKKDIQEIQVLAADKAIAFYGQKASNGVVLISRKKKPSKYLNYFLTKSE
jgi:hypothetical protein